MIQKKDWKKPFALILLLVLLGGYYEQLDVEMKTMVLPLAIFAAAGFIIARLKKLEYEMRSSKITAQKAVVQTFSVIDANGKERVSISATPDSAIMTFFDEEYVPRATMELFQGRPDLKLLGNKGSAGIVFDENGLPNIILKDDMDKIIWSAF
jgi:hypothetical protein